MILLAADGLENKKIAVRLGQDPGKVGRWRQRYVQMGLAGILKDKTRAGSDCSYCRFDALADCQTHAHGQADRSDALEPQIAGQRGRSEPFDSGAHLGGQWSEAASIRTFKLSKDKRFEEKLEDIVGLYLSPPEHAIVFVL